MSLYYHQGNTLSVDEVIREACAEISRLKYEFECRESILLNEQYILREIRDQHDARVSELSGNVALLEKMGRDAEDNWKDKLITLHMQNEEIVKQAKQDVREAQKEGYHAITRCVILEEEVRKLEIAKSEMETKWRDAELHVVDLSNELRIKSQSFDALTTESASQNYLALVAKHKDVISELADTHRQNELLSDKLHEMQTKEYNEKNEFSDWIIAKWTEFPYAHDSLCTDNTYVNMPSATENLFMKFFLTIAILLAFALMFADTFVFAILAGFVVLAADIGVNNEGMENTRVSYSQYGDDSDDDDDGDDDFDGKDNVLGSSGGVKIFDQQRTLTTDGGHDIEQEVRRPKLDAPSTYISTTQYNTTNAAYNAMTQAMRLNTIGNPTRTGQKKAFYETTVDTKSNDPGPSKDTTAGSETSNITENDNGAGILAGGEVIRQDKGGQRVFDGEVNFEIESSDDSELSEVELGEVELGEVELETGDDDGNPEDLDGGSEPQVKLGEVELETDVDDGGQEDLGRSESEPELGEVELDTDVDDGGQEDMDGGSEAEVEGSEGVLSDVELDGKELEAGEDDETDEEDWEDDDDLEEEEDDEDVVLTAEEIRAKANFGMGASLESRMTKKPGL